MDVIRHLKSLEFDFINIKVATDNFSEANKLVEDEFGVLYKVKYGHRFLKVYQLYTSQSTLIFQIP